MLSVQARPCRVEQSRAHAGAAFCSLTSRRGGWQGSAAAAMIVPIQWAL
jgi:hypothetical protein